MAIEPTLKSAVQRLREAFRALATSRRWETSEYQVYVLDQTQYGRIRVLLVTGDFDAAEKETRWTIVRTFLDGFFAEEPLPFGLTLGVRSFDEVAEGGIYSINPYYTEIDEFLATGPVAWAT